MSTDRHRALTALRARPVDVLVIGGGIVGAGIARDAALRGFRVALVEQYDLASGTSSRPTRLIHGGLRYLELYDFGLVRDDLREREILLRVAPHLVFPLPFLLPQYGRSTVYQAKLRTGMQLYDALSFGKSLPSRRWLSREAVLVAEPAINPEGLQGAWRYYDAQVPLVERLVVESALDAARQGALVLNRARAERFLRDPDGRVTGAAVRDLHGRQEVDVRAHVTVNATGPWLDVTSDEIRPGKRPLLRLTKGVHLVTPSGTRNAHVLFSQTDGRLFFVVPWLGYSLIGTTDTNYRGDPAAAAADAEDVEYLSTEARRVFPRAPFDRVYYAWAGVRALVRVEGVKEGQVSRKHKVLDHETCDGVRGVVSVVGGKITAYRSIAEEVGDLVSRKLGRRTRSYTDRRPFPGGAMGDLRSFVDSDLWPRAQALGLARDAAERLGRVYGSLAHEVLDLVERDGTLARPLCPEKPAIVAELVRAVESEWALTLADFLLRRSDLGLHADQALDDAERIAAAMGELLRWDATNQAEQVALYRAEIAPMRLFSNAAKGPSTYRLSRVCFGS
ncbi:MAG: glycerol-3-phosphate dehydrogenase [Chloroflexi bacterium]|nr:glycerol-3-phosphate dehydrogenase [Chloroflexota bacterium]